VAVELGDLRAVAQKAPAQEHVREVQVEQVRKQVQQLAD
jgi:hypothetical protein